MRAADLIRLYDYGYWANRRLFAALAQLSHDEFTQPVAGSYGSIRNTLVHTMSAEWGWLDRCGGEPRGAKLNPDDYPTLDSVVAGWSRVETSVRSFLAALRDDDLLRDVDWSIPGGPSSTAKLVDLMQHAAIHAVHHRGQIALLVRALGYPPGNFDLLFYAGEHPASA